jgi:cyanate permease
MPRRASERKPSAYRVSAMAAEQRNAPMAPLYVLSTGVTLAIPVIWAIMIVTVGQGIWKTSLIVIASFAALISLIWLYLRPSRYSVDGDGVRIRWYLREVRIPRAEIQNVSTIDREVLRRDFGWSARVGVGGLFGSFGLLWTSKRGWLSAYSTTTRQWVLIERKTARPILISPEQPDDFVRAVAK